MSIVTTRRAALLAGTAVLALGAQAAQAQVVDTPVSADPTEVEEIVVTGSRIATLPINSPQPVQVVTAETAVLQGQTQLADVLDRIPALQASTSSAEADGGAQVLNLRGLGSARTLVLVNGRRHVAGVPGSAAVDVSTIPSALVERVEVLTGGASAVYGSDAVTGVVNYILRDDFEGTEIDLQTGISSEWDGEEYFASVIHGRNFNGGRGNFTIGFQASDRKAVFYGDRDFSRDNRVGDGDYDNPALYFQLGDPLPPGFTFTDLRATRIVDSAGNPTIPGTDPALLERARNAPPFAYVNDPRFSISSTSGLIGIDLDGDGYADSAGAFSNPAVNADCSQSVNGLYGFGCYIVDPATGQVRPFQDGIYQGFTNQSGGDGAAQTFNNQSMTPEDRSYSLNLTANYEVTPAFRPFAEAKVAYNRGRSYSPYNTYDDAIQISLENPFIPAAIRSLIDAEIAADPTIAGTVGVTLARDHIDVVDPMAEQERMTYRAVIGARGDLGGGIAYEISANYGRTEQDTIAGRRVEDRWFAALDAVAGPSGTPVCRSTLDPTAVPPISGLYQQFPGPIPNPFQTFTPGAGSECRPLNLFGNGNVDPAAAAFVAPLATDRAEIDQFVFSAFLTGDTEQWFSLPGGPIGWVAGVEHRKETSDFDPNDFDEAGVTFRYANTAPVSGDFSVSEAFAELNLPILADRPFAHILTASFAARVGDYTTIGQATTYKADLVWAPVRDIRFRGGYASTVRAPNIAELFSPLETQGFRPIDPCHVNQVSLGSPTREANCRAALAAVGVTVGTPYDFDTNLTAQFFGATGGNPDLNEETSKSFTIGAVLQPRMLPGFTATIDYWNIEIEDAIASVSAQDIVDQCYDATDLNNQYCALLRRDDRAGSPTQGVFTYLEQTSLNFSRLEASGVDFGLNYNMDLADFGAPDWGSLRLGVQGTYLEDRNNYPFVAEPDRANIQKLEQNFPEWAANTTVQWVRGDWTASLFSNYQTKQARFRTEIEDIALFDVPFDEDRWSHDASVQWRGLEDTTITVGVNNLTNEEPNYGLVATPVSGVGRYFFLRVNHRL